MTGRAGPEVRGDPKDLSPVRTRSDPGPESQESAPRVPRGASVAVPVACPVRDSVDRRTEAFGGPTRFQVGLTGTSDDLGPKRTFVSQWNTDTSLDPLRPDPPAVQVHFSVG